jgi:uncharacterized protein (TIGR03083 family)
MMIPIPTLHLFPELDKKLIELLRSLSTAEWNNPTLARKWTVKDIAAHLLDGNLRAISHMRDQYFGDPPGTINSYQDLVDHLNRLNADFVQAAKRLSPTLLIDLLESTGPLYIEQLRKLDPHKPAMFAVSWAGQTESPNWFHIAREYTEKWHHQQQIRDAVGKPGIMTKEFFAPLIETFIQALPHAFRNTHAPDGTCVRVEISTEVGNSWQIVCNSNTWSFQKDHATPHTSISLDPDTAWKLFTKGLSAEDAKKKIQVKGDAELSQPIFSMLAVMA